MLRTVSTLGLVGSGIVVVALGGHIGPVDLTEVPVPFFAFAGVTGLVLLGLRKL